MKKLLFIFIIYVFSKGVNSDLNGNCDLQNVNASQWVASYINIQVNDNHQSEFHNFKVTNVESVQMRKNGSQYSEYFEVDLTTDKNNVIVKPSTKFQDFERHEVSDREFREMYIILEFQCKEGEGVLRFYQPINDLNSFNPAMIQSPYTYELPMPLPSDFNLACLGHTIEACDYDITNSGLNFSVTPPDDFSINWEATIDEKRKCHRATIITKKSLRLTEDTIYTITVKDVGNPPLETSSTLTIRVDEQTSFPVTPQFKSAFYTATYNDDNANHSIRVDETIHLEKLYPGTKINFRDYSNCFDYKIESNQVTVTLIENLPKDVLADNSVVYITMEAILENAEGPGRTVLVIKLPISDQPTTECPITCPTPDITTTCSPYLTTPTPGPPSIKFERDNYWLESVYKYIGFIGFVRGTAASGEAIKYSLEGIGGSQVPKELQYDENTGELKIAEELSIGQYSVTAVAKGVTSNTETRASVVININDNMAELHTTDSIIVKHVFENQEANIKLPCEDENGDCEYVIFDQYPPPITSLFEIRDGNLHCAELNRQMEEVQNMHTPQFIISLQLTRIGGQRIFGSGISNHTTHLLSKRNAQYADGDREWVYIPENVVNKVDQLLVSIIIEDVNDNTPVFEGDGRMVVGYPNKKLAIQLAPPYLTKVHATDLDVGINADIKYSTGSAHFIIHRKTGVVYPTASAFEDDSNLKFTITATDMDGDKTGNSAPLEIEVILLDQIHLTLLTVKNLMLEDVDNKLQELSEKIGIHMKYLTAAVVPSTSTDPTRRKLTFSKSTPLARAVADHLTKIVVYALDNINEPVETDKIKDELEGAGMLEDISIDNWKPPSGGDEDCECTGNTCEEPSTAGYIAAISVLASLVIIFIIAASVFYYFKMYRQPKPYATMKDEDTGSIDFEKNPKVSVVSASEEIAQRRPTGFIFNPPQIEADDEDEFGENKVKYEIPVDFYATTKQTDEADKTVYDNPINYSTDYVQKNKDNEKPVKFADTTNSVPISNFLGAQKKDELVEKKLQLESSSLEQKDKPKSVTFKPTVEKINIIADDKLDDNDNIFDERL